MRWNPGQRSEDLEDRREESGGGGGLRLPGGRGLGLGGVLVVLALSLVFRQDLFAMLDTGPVAAVPGGAPARSSSPEEEKLVGFVSFVLDDVQATWAKELPGAGRDYRRAKLVLFRDAYPSGCGEAEAATGPFYCPADEKVYIDLGFYDDLKRFGAPGEFAQAYVIAHELGHHVQNILGVNRKVRAAQEAHPAQANALSVRLELQADCLAGMWGRSTDQRHLLESGDVEAGLAAAAAVGDDRLQRMGGGRVNPESWTHGSAQQRVAWFRRGLQSGAIGDCDTFSRTAP